MQKSALQYGEIIFQSKVIPLFLPKCSKLHSFYIWYTAHGQKDVLNTSKRRIFIRRKDVSIPSKMSAFEMYI